MNLASSASVLNCRFADNTRIQSTEPQPFMNDTSDENSYWIVWAAANLTEDDLLDAGFSLGVEVSSSARLLKIGSLRFTFSISKWQV